MFINYSSAEKFCVTDTNPNLKSYIFTSCFWIYLDKLIHIQNLHIPAYLRSLSGFYFSQFLSCLNVLCNNNEMIRWMTSLFHVLSDIVTSSEDATESSNCPWYRQHGSTLTIISPLYSRFLFGTVLIWDIKNLTVTVPNACRYCFILATSRFVPYCTSFLCHCFVDDSRSKAKQVPKLNIFDKRQEDTRKYIWKGRCVGN